MEFVEITDLLDQKNLKSPNFDFLKPDHEFYEALLYQPKHSINANPRFVRSVDRELAKNKFSKFIDKVLDQQLDLAIAPEYSCPWETIDELLEEQKLPRKNNLWAFGCESIEPINLQKIIDSHKEIVWLYDEQLVNDNLKSENFLNPLCYLFTAVNKNNEVKHVVAIQFKTHPLGGIQFENRNMIKGKNLYTFQNEGDTIKLTTFICSDVLNPKLTELLEDREKAYPYLFLHIQLNSNPCNKAFRNYRDSIFKTKNDRDEIICLNWGRKLSLNGEDCWSDFGGSAIYTKSGELDLSENRLNTNHKLGLYFTWSYGKKKNFYFNYDEYLFHFRSTKPSQYIAPGVNAKRTGPEIINTYKWDDQWIPKDEINDGFTKICESIESSDDLNLEFIKNEDLSPTDKERLLTLSIGKVEGQDWHKVNKSEFFHVNEEEYIKRVTFTHHPNQDIRKQRIEHLIKFAQLENNILSTSDHYPDNIADLRNNCKINYKYAGDKSESNFNLYPVAEERGAKATVAYLGTTSSIVAKAITAKLMDLFDNNQSDKRVVVWYLDSQNNISSITSGAKPAQSDTKRSNRSIFKTD